MAQLSVSATATASSTGTALISLPLVPVGREWVGTVSVPGLPAAGVVTITVDGTLWGQTTGSAPFGPIYAPGRSQVILTISGATAGASLTAVMHGEDSAIGRAPPAIPTPFTGPVSSVQSVTDSVPSLGRNVFYWPCISGESFPPTFANSAGYYNSANSAIPGFNTDTDYVWVMTGKVGTAQWPYIPRYIVGTQGGISVSFLLGIGESNGSDSYAGILSLQAYNSPSISLQLVISGSSINGATTPITCQAQNGFPGGTSVTFNTHPLAPYTAAGSIDIDGSGNVSVSWNGETHSVGGGFVIGEYPPPYLYLYGSRTTDSTDAQVLIGQILASYS